MKQKSEYKKGLLDYLIPWCPLWFPYMIGIYYKNLIEPFKYGFLQYRKFYNFLQNSQWWPKEKLEQYQAEKLKDLINYVYVNIPYYESIFKQRKLKPVDFTSARDLKKLPILTKEDVIKNFDALISKKNSKKNRKRLKAVYTSGSTGKSMLFYRDNKFQFMEETFHLWRLSLANISPYAKYIRLWSRPFIERNLRDIYLHQPYEGRLSLSTIPTQTNQLGEYLGIIRGFKPLYVRSSPSFLYQLAQYAQQHSNAKVRFPVFFSGYENLYSFQRKLIQDQFHCEVFNYYASEEYLIYAVECNRHEGMHLEIRKGVMEIVDKDGQILDNEQQGRIICTGFDNHAMPLIRYDMEDIGSISNKQCSCGRGLPLLKSLDGRASEVIKYNGKIIYPATLSVILERFRNIKECQFVQDKEDKIRINIVKRRIYSSYDTKELIKFLKYLIGKEFDAQIHFVDTIPKTKMGKFQFVINRLMLQR